MLASLSKSQRNFLAFKERGTLKVHAIPAAEVADFLCNVSACFLFRKKKKNRREGSTKLSRSSGIAVPRCTWARHDYIILLY